MRPRQFHWSQTITHGCSLNRGVCEEKGKIDVKVPYTLEAKKIKSCVVSVLEKAVWSIIIIAFKPIKRNFLQQKQLGSSRKELSCQGVSLIQLSIHISKGMEGWIQKRSHKPFSLFWKEVHPGPHVKNGRTLPENFEMRLSWLKPPLDPRQRFQLQRQRQIRSL